MGKRYTEKEKITALRFMYKLKKNGSVEIDDKNVENIRDLCKALKVSSYTIYKWDKEIVLDLEKNPLEKKLLEIHDIVKNGKTKQNHFDPDPKKVEDNRLIVNSEIRYFGTLASMLKIKGYADMPLKQLQLAIGLKLVQRSKLA